MHYFTGIDIGSTSIKIAIIDDSGKLVNSITTPTGSRFAQNAVDALNRLLSEVGISPDDNGYTISTGYGRKLFKASDEAVNEITSNVVGVQAMGSSSNQGFVKQQNR